MEAATTALTKPTEGYTPVAKPYPTATTGRRLVLALWITSNKNPLTARVAIQSRADADAVTAVLDALESDPARRAAAVGSIPP